MWYSPSIKRTASLRSFARARLLDTAALLGVVMLAAHAASAGPLRATRADWSLPGALQRSVALSRGDRLLVLGGLTAVDESSNQVLTIDPRRGGKPRVIGHLALATHDAAGAVIEGLPVVFGGGANRRQRSAVQVLVGRGRVRVRAQLPLARSDLSAATVNGTTYLVGGFDGKRALAGVLATRDGRHFRTVARLPYPLRYAAVTAIGRRLIIAGGDRVAHRRSDVVLALDLRDETVKPLGRLPMALGHAIAFTLDGRVFIAGGLGPRGETSRAIWAVDPNSGAVTRAGTLPYPVSDAPVAVIGNRAWIIGGRGANGAALASVITLASTPRGTVAPQPGSTQALPAPGAALSWLAPAKGPGYLQPGSDPSVLPGPVMIADEGNNRIVVVDPYGRVRWEFPRPGDLAPGQTFLRPDDVFVTPDGRHIIATEEEDQVVSLIDIAKRRIVWRYGKPGVPGYADNHLSHPDDALMLPGGDVLLSDIKNCRVLLIAPGTHRPLRALGKPGYCAHRPPERWGSPNGAFPMRNGHFLLTEIRGNWVDEIDLRGKVYWSMHPPGIHYPSDTNEIATNRYLTVDYVKPGQVLIFDRQGQALWRYKPRGRDALNHPSLALPLPNGDVILNDDANHRIIVVDPRSDKIVWQYGFTGRAGRDPGYLDNPDGLDLLPPYSMLIDFAPSMGKP